MGIERHRIIICQQPQQKPFLLLTNADRFFMAPDIARGQSIAMPTLGAGENTDVLRLEPNLFVKLAVHGLFGAFTRMYAALRKLPGIATINTLAPEHAATPIAHNNPDIGPKAVGIDNSVFVVCAVQDNVARSGGKVCYWIGSPYSSTHRRPASDQVVDNIHLVTAVAFLMPLALFDLDNTLLNGDSDHRWGEFLCAIGRVDRDTFAAQNDRFFADYQAGQLDIDAYLQFALAPFAGMTPDEVAPLQEIFVRDYVTPMLQAKASSLLAQHRAQGDHLVIITATNTLVTRPIADKLGVATLIGSEVGIADGRYTGAPAGVPSFREGKVSRLEAWLTDTGMSLQGASFYSDSHNDLPLLELVEHPVAVDPDPLLRAHATRMDWPIISLRE